MSLTVHKMKREQAGSCCACKPPYRHHYVWVIQMNTVIVRLCEKHIRQLKRAVRLGGTFYG